MLKSIALFFFLLSFSEKSIAQEYPLQHYSIKEGLPHASVYRIFQDKKGFLWFSTNFGVSKFDGRSFKNYSSAEGLSNNVIMSVSENEAGDKFVSTYKGGIDIITDSGIHPFRVTKGTIPKLIVQTFPQKNRLWIISLILGNRLFVADKNEIKQVPIKCANGKEANVNRIRYDGKNILLVTSNGIYKVVDDTTITPFLLNEQNIIDLKEDKRGGYWVLLKSRLVHLSNGTISKSYELDGENINGDILIDRLGNVWVFSNPNSLYLIRGDDIANIRLQMDIPNVFITCLYEDIEGNIWIATQGDGVYRLSSLDGLKYSFKKNYINSYCTAISQGKEGEFLLGSFGKLSLFKGGTLKEISSSLKPTEYVYFIRYYNNKFYVGTSNRLLIKDVTYPYSEYQVNKERLGAISMCVAPSGQILVGNFENLYKILNNKLILFDSSGYFNGKRCNKILYEKDTLWVLTDSGTIKYYCGSGRYQSLPSNTNSFICADILKDSHGKIWFSTKDGLVCKVGTTYKVYTTKDGLSDNLCKALYEDNDGNLWVSTGNNKLNIINLSTLAIKEQIIDIDLSEILALYRADNKLYVTTIEGLAIVDLTNDATGNRPLPTYVTSIKTDKVQSCSPSVIELKYKDNKLQIEFVGINFRHPENVEYRYMIRGIDKEWNITKSNSVEFSSLPGGNYLFAISNRLKNGEWGPETILPIIVETPLYQRSWAQLTFFLVTIVLVYLISRKIVLRAATKKNEHLLIRNKIAYLKQQALMALMNPHFIFNCMNSIQHYLNKNDKEAANIYLSEFASLIRMSLEDAQKAFISLETEIGRITLYLSLEKLRFGDKLQYEVLIDDAIRDNIGAIYIPNMILQPYVENAIIHGIVPKKSSGRVTISLTKINTKEMIITIQDNGLGINYVRNNHYQSEHNSFGIKLTAERLTILERLMGQYYHVSIAEVVNHENAITGTKVEITLPLYNDSKKIDSLEHMLSR